MKKLKAVIQYLRQALDSYCDESYRRRREEKEEERRQRIEEIAEAVAIGIARSSKTRGPG